MTQATILRRPPGSAIQVVQSDTESVALADAGAAASGSVAALGRWDWSTLTGSSTTALSDASKALPFDMVDNAQGCLSVVTAASTGLTFPAGMTNVLRVRKNAGENFFGFCRIGSDASGTHANNNPHWAELNIGDTIKWRVYMLVNAPNGAIITTYNSNHPIQSPHWVNDFWEPCNFTWKDSAGASNASTYKLHNFAMFQGGGVNGGYYAVGAGNSYESDGFPGLYFPKFVAQRYEWWCKRETSLGYSVGQRIYDLAGTLLASSDPTGDGLAATKGITCGDQAGGPLIPLKSRDGLWALPRTSDVTSLAIGSNGGHIYNTTVDWYLGGLCVYLNAEPGPYNSTTG